MRYQVDISVKTTDQKGRTVFQTFYNEKLEWFAVFAWFIQAMQTMQDTLKIIVDIPQPKKTLAQRVMSVWGKKPEEE